MENHQTASREQLAAWFSEPRITRYLGQHTDTLYIWNTRITKAFLEDIQHVEVALRNLIDRSLVAARDADWLYDSAFLNMNPHLKRSISKAQRRAGGETVHRHKILAELSFDTWRYLLTQRHQQKVWKHVRQNLPNYTVPRRPLAPFEEEVEIIYKLRNRCAHHEPLVQVSLTQETQHIQRYIRAIDTLAGWLDPQLALWIRANSRVGGLLASRPALNGEVYL